MIAAVTYSTRNFEKMRKLNVKTAYSKGKADIVYEFTENDIDEGFKAKYKAILTTKRGAGLWLWKPYSIKKALSMVNEDDYLMYSDAGSFYVDKIEHLINSLELSGQSIMVFELPLISKQWTKHETFVRMNCDNSGFQDRNQILANFILLKKNNESVRFINEYLEYCCDEICISNKLFDATIENPKEFLAHRSDQSILSILSMKYDLTPFRDPSQYGKRPWEYFFSKEIIYLPGKYMNSNYPTIFLLTRKEVNYYYYVIKHLLKTFLSKFPAYIQWELKRRSNISKKEYI